MDETTREFGEYSRGILIIRHVREQEHTIAERKNQDWIRIVGGSYFVLVFFWLLLIIIFIIIYQFPQRKLATLSSSSISSKRQRSVSRVSPSGDRSGLGSCGGAFTFGLIKSLPTKGNFAPLFLLLWLCCSFGFSFVA